MQWIFLTSLLYNNNYTMTTIDIAAQRGFVTMLRELEKRGIDMNAKGNYGHTPIFRACMFNHNSTMKLFLSEFKYINSNVNDQSGLSMVYQCLLRSFFHQLSTLAKYGHDFSNDREMCKDVINKESFEEEITASFWACKNNDKYLLQQLIRCGCNLNYKNRYEETAAHHAAMNGSLDCLKILSNIGANISHPDNLGNTPLEKANEYGNKECAQFLSQMKKEQHSKGLSKDIHQLAQLAMT